MRKSKIEERTLCTRCRSDYENSGFVLVRRGWQDTREACDFCQTGMGWTYAVFERGGKR